MSTLALVQSKHIKLTQIKKYQKQIERTKNILYMIDLIWKCTLQVIDPVLSCKWMCDWGSFIVGGVNLNLPVNILLSIKYKHHKQ